MLFNIRNVNLEHIEYFYQDGRMKLTEIQGRLSTSKGNLTHTALSLESSHRLFFGEGKATHRTGSGYQPKRQWLDDSRATGQHDQSAQYGK